MTSATCPHCGSVSYSSVVAVSGWKCPYCGSTVADEARRYIDERGRLIFVRAGWTEKAYKVVYQTAGRHGAAGAKRLVSPALQICETAEEAQR